MIELQILKAFVDNPVYIRKYINYINYHKYKDIKPTIYSLFYIIDKYDKTTPLSLDNLEILYHTQYPRAAEDAAVIFSKLRSVTYDAELIEEMLYEEHKRSTATKAALLAVKVADNFASYDELVQLVSQISSPPKEENTKISVSLTEVLNTTVLQRGLRWRLQCLNRSIGSLRQGNFGFAFARVERGKTAFAVSEFIHMARQTDKPCIYFGNEESGNGTLLRMYSAHFGRTLKELTERHDEYTEKFINTFGDRIIIIDDASMSAKGMHKICKELNPGLVVIDQLDKIKGIPKADRHDLQMKAGYQFVRELSKEFCPIIGLTQADGAAIDKKWLTDDNIDSSKTAKPGEADWIIGIGAVDEFPDMRFLNIIKNKLPGDEDTEPKLRHSRWEVAFWPELSRYEDIK